MAASKSEPAVQLAAERARLRSKIALITGAAGGIGQATARRFAREGAALVLVDREERRGALEGLATAVPTDAIAVPADVRDQSTLDAAVSVGVDRFGALDIVFANAGVISHGPVEAVSEEEWQRVIDIDLGGVFRTVKAAARALKADRHRPGSIVITSSTAGLKASAGGGTYAAAKTGLIGLARAWAHEFGPYSVRVNTVHPTATATPLVFNDKSFRRARPDLEHPGPDDVREPWSRGKLLDTGWIEPEDVAAAVLFLASDEARFITGVQLPVDAGSTTKWG